MMRFGELRKLEFRHHPADVSTGACMQESDKRGHVQEHGAKNEAPAAGISHEAALVLPETLDITVTREILSLATRMAAALDISVPNERWPTVRVSESAQTSAYSLEDNSITIAKKHVNCGGTYAEEVTHFLKAITMPPPENPEENIVDMDYYMAFQEMCGRLGRDFAERLCAGSELAHLFVGSNEDEGGKDCGSSPGSRGETRELPTSPGSSDT
jgi:hypothetical protein